MQSPKTTLLCAVFSLVLIPNVLATTFVVPNDRAMVRRAEAIVVASPITSYAQSTSQGGIETVTLFVVQEVIKGMPLDTDTIEVHEPGGELGGRAMVIAGAPRFSPGDGTIVFLNRTPQQTWAVTDLVLGAFRLTSDRAGRHVAVREETDVAGWDPNGLPHKERRRSAELFLQFLRAEARGGMGVENYVVPTEPLVMHSLGASKPGRVTASAVFALAFTGRSYTSDVGAGNGARWNVFPSGVNIFSGANGEPGAPGGGVTAVQTAINSWDNDCGSVINYVYAGADSTHTSGLAAPDGANTILFERNLTAYGAGAFSCSGSGYGGTLGIGGITSTSGTHVLNGEAYYTTNEGDVEMNQGIANCTLLFNNGDWNSAVTHEVGHTLGFRHSDQTRANNPSVPCSSDPSLECSSAAIMRSSIPPGYNGALQPWDVNAARGVYPGGTCVTCNPPSITAQPQSTTINSGSSASLSVTATGTGPLSYQWYVGASGNTASPISGATGPSITVSPASTTSYWVRVSNACGSANSATATVTVNPAPPPPPRRARGDFDGDGKGDILLRNPSTGENAMFLMDGVTIRSAAYIQSSAWSIAGTGDLNGDGYADIVFRNTSTGQNAAWLMQGFSIVGSAYLLSTDPAFHLAAVADFDGDGKADLLWRNDATGENVIWLMNGLTATVGAYISPAAWSLAATADFNGDGRADLFWHNDATGQNAIWLMNRFSIIGSNYLPSTDPAYSLAAAADFDGDGKDDIIWRNNSNGSCAMWLMSGLTTKSGAWLSTISTAFRLVGASDFDGDGHADILWRNVSTGENLIWLMNGFSVVRSANVQPTLFTPVSPAPH